MSVVSFMDLGAPKPKESRANVRGRSISIREENDSRRIRPNQDDLMNRAVVGRPSTAPAPYLQKQSGPGDISALNVQGPKLTAVSKAVSEFVDGRLSAAKSGGPIRSSSPDARDRGLGSRQSSPGLGRRSTAGRVNFSDSIQPDGESYPATGRGGSGGKLTLENRLAVNEVLNDRDQAALKMGRLVLNTVMNTPDLTTEDSIARFFFDNWLAKSGSSSQQADSYSIELMSHLQAQIAQARAEAPFLIETPRPLVVATDDDKAGANDDEDEDGDGAVGKRRDQDQGKSTASSSISGGRSPQEPILGTGNLGNRPGMFRDLPVEVVKNLGENVVHKTVGSVAMEALDRCIIEFGKGNPILFDIKEALLPLIFAEASNPDILEKLMAVPPATSSSLELDGGRYLGYATWLEDAHLMFGNCERALHDKKMGDVHNAALTHEMRVLEGKFKKEQARIQPLVQAADDMRRSRDEQMALKAQLEEAMQLLETGLLGERDAKIRAIEELESLKILNIDKDADIFQLHEMVAQMEKDKLPDIREEYSASLKRITELQAHSEDLQLAIDNFKIMLKSQKEFDEGAEKYLTAEAVRVADKMKILNDENCDSSLEGQGRVFAAVLSNDDLESARRIYQPLSHFFSDKHKALNGSRHAEYMELRDRLYSQEAVHLLAAIRTLRSDLIEAKEAVQKVINNYEAKLSDIRAEHKAELSSLREAHRIELISFEDKVIELGERIAELTSTVQTLNDEIARLNSEWISTRAELEKTRQTLEEALSNLQKAHETISRQASEISDLSKRLHETEVELTDTKEELVDTKKELAETVRELRAADENRQRIEREFVISKNELGMALSDDWMVTRYQREKALLAKTQGQLDFARVEVRNVKEKLVVMQSEMQDLTAELAERTRDNGKLESKIGHLENTIEKLNFLIELRENRILWQEKLHDEESMLAADRYHRAEQVVLVLKGSIANLVNELTEMTNDRNEVVLQREALRGDLRNMELRAVDAEESILGSQTLNSWMGTELEKCIYNMTKPKDPNDAFDDDFGVSPDDLQRSMSKLSAGTFIQKVSEPLKAKSIDVIVHADRKMRGLAATFTDSISSLENALAVSREIIRDAQELHESDEYAGAMQRGGNKTATKVSTTLTTYSHVVTAGDTESLDGSVGGHSLQIVPDGFKLYDPVHYHLVHVEVSDRNKELMTMLRNDLHGMHSDKHHILDHVMDIHNYHAVQRFADAEYDAPSAREGSAVGNGHGNAHDHGNAHGSVMSHNEHTLRVLKSAAVAVERENPLRERVEKQMSEIIVLENTLAELRVDKEELIAELAASNRETDKLKDKVEGLQEQLVEMTKRQEQSMRAVAEQEREVVRVRQEVEESSRRKKNEAHPAVKMQMMQEAAKGNPKKLVQPFLHFLRRNESDISRHLGQNVIAMREVRGLCSRVNTAIDALLEEEAQYYYRKHNNDDDVSKLLETIQKTWKTLRETKADVTEYTSWVFEGQDISLGNDKIRRALKIDGNDSSFLDPLKAVGDNHLAAAYENHSKKTAANAYSDEIGDDLKDDVVDNLDAVAENLRCDAFRSGDWRMQLYNLNGTVDLGMPVHDWPLQDKVNILDCQLQAAKDKIKAERELASSRMEKIKREKNDTDRKMDEVRDEMKSLQEEYGAKGVQHDFMVYKRIKKGILDGTLEKAGYNLPEIVYSPQDFEDVELGIYQAVQTLIDLCRESGEPEKPPNPFPEGDPRNVTSTFVMPPKTSQEKQLSSASRPKTPKKGSEGNNGFGSEGSLKAEEIGASGMDISNMAFTTVGRLNSAQGSRHKNIPLTVIAPVMVGAGSRSAAAAPQSDWRQEMSNKKKEKALSKYHAENQPARYASGSRSHSSGEAVKRGTPGESFYQPSGKADEPSNAAAGFGADAATSYAVEEAKQSAVAVDEDDTPLEWSNAKSADLVRLLDAAVKKVQMRVLYAKMIRPSSRASSPDRDRDRGERRKIGASVGAGAVTRTNTTANLLQKLAIDESFPIPHYADFVGVVGSDAMPGDIASDSINQKEMTDVLEPAEEEAGGERDSVKTVQLVNSGDAASQLQFHTSSSGYFAQLPQDFASQFAKELFSDGAEIVPEDEARVRKDVNNDISTFVSKLNAKVNKHITSAKLFESIVEELEATRQKSGVLDISTVNRIYALRMSTLGEEPVDMASMMDKLSISSPPDVLARATHLVRDHHHHLVLEEKADRKFVNGAWGGRPKFDRGEPQALQHAQKLETSTPFLQRTSSLSRSTDSGAFGGLKHSSSGILDPRVPNPSDFCVSNVSIALTDNSVAGKAKKSAIYVKPTAAKVLNVALVPVSQRRLETKSEYLNHISEAAASDHDQNKGGHLLSKQKSENALNEEIIYSDGNAEVRIRPSTQDGVALSLDLAIPGAINSLAQDSVGFNDSLAD